MENNRFFSSLKAVKSFIDVTNPHLYEPLPKDWLLAITDVQGSTKAIEQGRYRDVNVLGASSLMAILNAIDGADVPYVFGGDGATLAFPPEFRERVVTALKASQRLAEKKFKLKLRAAIIPLDVIRAGGTDVRIARYEVGPTASIAMFRGGGCGFAEALLKDDALGAPYRIDVSKNEKVDGDFDGLQCRWDPIAAKKGHMVTLMLAARPSASADLESMYRELISRIDEIVGNMQSPAQRTELEAQLGKSWYRPGLSEVKVISFGKGLWETLKVRMRIIYEMAGFRLLLQKGTKGEVFDPNKYLDEVPRATDFRKFDDTLRMVFDCEDQRLEVLQSYLEEQKNKGRIFYGLHKSDHALMTCLVFDYNNHLHLIDGSEGGYNSAAKQFKQQIKQDIKASA